MTENKIDYSGALKAIQDIALNILGKGAPSSVVDDLELILSIARYGHDVRTKEETKHND